MFSRSPFEVVCADRLTVCSIHSAGIELRVHEFNECANPLSDRLNRLPAIPFIRGEHFVDIGTFVQLITSFPFVNSNSSRQLRPWNLCEINFSISIHRSGYRTTSPVYQMHVQLISIVWTESNMLGCLQVGKKERTLFFDISLKCSKADRTLAISKFNEKK